MKSPSAHLFVMKSPSYLLLFLSLTSSCIASTDPDPQHSRDLKMTQAQRFASVANPRATSMEQFKAQLKSKQETSGNSSNSKLSLALGEALSLNRGADAIRGHDDRTTIMVDKTADVNGGSLPKDKLQKKDQGSNENDGDKNNVLISKFSAALGEAMNNHNDRDVGGGTEKHVKKEKELSNMEGRSSALPQGS